MSSVSRRLAWLAAVTASLLTLSTACAGADVSTTEATPTTTGAAAPVSYPVTVGSVTLTERPERVVSLSPTATEILFAVDAGAQVAAVDDQSNYPAQAPKTKLSGFTPNAEAIAAENPDLVVIANDTNKIVSQLTALKIPVFLAPAATTLDDTYAQINDLGTLTDHVGEATALVAQMKGDIAKLVKDLPDRPTPLTYYYELDPTLYTVTSRTFIGSLFTAAGLVNVADAAAAAGNDYPQLSAEALVKADPDLIFLADTKCCEQSAQTVAARPGWASMSAVRAGRVVALDDDVASRWGPRVVDLLRAIVDAVAQVQ